MARTAGPQVRGRGSILRDDIYPKRALRPSRTAVRFEVPPDRQLQADWGVAPAVLAGEPNCVQFLGSTPGYSRWFFLRTADA